MFNFLLFFVSFKDILMYDFISCYIHIYIYIHIYKIFYVYFLYYILIVYLYICLCFFYFTLFNHSYLKYLIPGERLLLIRLLFMCNPNVNRKGLLLCILLFISLETSHLEASFNHIFFDFNITTFSFTSR